MDNAQIFENLKVSIVEGDSEKALENAKEALKLEIDPLKIVEQGLSKGMDIIGEKFETGEMFLPELLMAAEAFKAAMVVIQPELEAQQLQTVKKGTVLISTVKGDLHNIGKNIVQTVLGTKGYDVVDIGIDNGTLDIIQEAKKVQADIIALSCLMTTTMPAQREIIDTLKEMGIRDQFTVIVGGGPVTQSWSDEIGANGYGQSAIQAAEVVKELMEKKG